MSRVPRELALRLDRLAWRVHAFHRWAHHPLCAEYEGEVVRMGRKTRLCRGCLMAGLGTGAGIAAGLLWRIPDRALPVFAIASAVVLLGSLYLRPSRHSKLSTRFLPLLLTALTVVSGLRSLTLSGAGLGLGVLALLGLGLARYGRRGPWRGPCAACAERALPATCRGMREVLRRERAFARLASRLLSRPRL